MDKQSFMLPAALVVLAGGLFLIDLLAPPWVAIWLLYVGVVLLSLWFPARWPTFTTAATCTGLMALGLIFSTVGEAPFWTAVVNRLLGVLAVWVAAFAGLAARRTLQLQETNARLQREILERQRTQERLREQASLLDLAHDAIMVRDLDDHIVYWNRGAERLYGWRAEEALGREAGDLLFRSRCEEVAEARRRLLETGQWEGEFRQVTRARRDILVESHWTLVRDGVGCPKAVLVVNSDLTEKKKLQAQLLRTQRLESVGILASGIAHDFNNLLTPMLMAAKLLREERPEPERRHLVETMQASAERGTELVRQVLSFAGGTDGQRTAVQVKHLIKEVQSILGHTFPKTVQVETALDEDLRPVLGDPTQLSQVLVNLCVNARDAMPAGGTLAIRAENVELDQEQCRVHGDPPPGPYVAVSVTDTGCGIAPDLLDQVFDPFFTTKEPGKGTGLGLSTALGIVKSHHGFIDVTSELGQGTRFTIYLPAAAGKEETAPPQTPIPCGKGELVLVVDDEVPILETVRTTLLAHGYRVATAADGKEALQVYARRRGEIEAVVLDLMMPGMDGVTTMAALDVVDPRARVILSSGLRSRAELPEVIGSGARAFLQKPYSDEQLLTTLAKVLQTK
jgi:PAS domain S-box-containing protein